VKLPFATADRRANNTPMAIITGLPLTPINSIILTNSSSIAIAATSLPSTNNNTSNKAPKTPRTRHQNPKATKNTTPKSQGHQEHDTKDHQKLDTKRHQNPTKPNFHLSLQVHKSHFQLQVNIWDLLHFFFSQFLKPTGYQSSEQ
jgi:hypothetical protein